MSRNPLFQVMCVLQNQPQAAAGIEGLVLCPLPVDTATAKFDLTVFWHESAGRLLGLLEFNTDLFDPATAWRLSQHYEALLRGAVAAPDQPFTALPLLSPAERHQALVEWNGTEEPAAEAACVHHWWSSRSGGRPRPWPLSSRGGLSPTRSSTCGPTAWPTACAGRG